MKHGTTPSSQPCEWLTVGDAARLLGVHPSTLRRWADRGQVRCMRTPGGHRRFLERDLTAFLEAKTEVAGSDEPESLARSLVLHTRRELEVEEIRGTPWHAAFDEAERAERRASGRRLLGLAIQFTSRRAGRDAVLEEACRIGRRYGRDAAEKGLSLVNTMKAFLFFRESVIRSARPGLVDHGRYDAEDVHIHRSLREFLDEVLFAAMAAYDQAQHVPPPGQEGSQ